MIKVGDPIYIGLETGIAYSKPGPGRSWIGWARDDLFEGEALCLKDVTREMPGKKKPR